MQVLPRRHQLLLRRTLVLLPLSLFISIFILLLHLEIISNLPVDPNFFLAQPNMLNPFPFLPFLLPLPPILLNRHDHLLTISRFNSPQRFLVGKRLAGLAHPVLEHTNSLQFLGLHGGPPNYILSQARVQIYRSITISTIH